MSWSDKTESLIVLTMAEITQQRLSRGPVPSKKAPAAPHFVGFQRWSPAFPSDVFEYSKIAGLWGLSTRYRLN